MRELPVGTSEINEAISEINESKSFFNNMLFRGFERLLEETGTLNDL